MLKVVPALGWKFALTLAWWLFGHDPYAAAQPLGEVAVVPLTSGDSAAAIDLAAALETDLLERHVPLVRLHEARDRFTARSRSPQPVTNDDLHVLAEAARQASEHVAFGRTAAAQRSVQEVIERAEHALETLNRETETARHVLDACLALVRSALQDRKRETALAQAMRCRRLVPDLAPSATAHPAEVVGALAEADSLLVRMHVGRLAVRSTSEERCSVYVNGRHLGTTPFDLDHAASGVYRVQVECSKQFARVHVVRLGDDPTTLLVDTDFDLAVRTEPRLALQYGGQRPGEALVEHARQLGAEIGASNVITVEVSNGRATLSRIQVEHGRMVAQASGQWPVSTAELRSSLAIMSRALLEGRLEGPQPTGDQTNTVEVVSTRSSVPVPSESPLPSLLKLDGRQGKQEKPFWRAALEGSTFVLGAASFAAAGVLIAKRHREGDAFRRVALTDGSYVLHLDDWQRTRPGPYLFGSLGTSLLIVGIVDLNLSAARRAPGWFAILAGVVGVATASVGVVDVLLGGPCDGPATSRKSCSEQLEVRDRGAFALIAAVPLLTFATLNLLRNRASSSSRSSWNVLPDVNPFSETLAITATVAVR